MSARNLVKETAWTATAPFLKGRDISDCPAWAANLFELKLPSNTTVKDETSPDGGANINVILDLMNECRSTPGDIAECGVYRGSTLISMALYFRQIGSDRKIFGFDSFQGFDDYIKIDLTLGGAFDRHKRKGGFSQTSQLFVQKKLNALGLNQVQLIPGFFKDTFRYFPERSFSFVHLDCDIYESYRTCLNYFFPRLNYGGIILLDEYDDPPWPGCNLAVNKFLADNPVGLQSIIRDGHQKFYIRRDFQHDPGAAQANLNS